MYRTRVRTMLAALPLLALMLFSAARPKPALAEWLCGGGGTSICKETEACIGYWIVKICTKTYDYWNWVEPKDKDSELN
jgi:hypothetical protein